MLPQQRGHLISEIEKLGKLFLQENFESGNLWISFFQILGKGAAWGAASGYGYIYASVALEEGGEAGPSGDGA